MVSDGHSKEARCGVKAAVGTGDGERRRRWRRTARRALPGCGLQLQAACTAAVTSFQGIYCAQAIPCLLRAMCPKPSAPAQLLHDLTTRRDENKQVDRAPRALRVHPRPRVLGHHRIDRGHHACQSSGTKYVLTEIFAIYMSNVCEQMGRSRGGRQEIPFPRKIGFSGGSFLRIFAEFRDAALLSAGASGDGWIALCLNLWRR